MTIIIELRLLKYFITVAEELHFGRAAERLHMAQPSLSQQICQLEQKLGVKLLKRTKRKTELTYAGKIFLEGSLEVLDLVNKTIEKTRQAQNKTEQLSIAATGMLLEKLVPEAIRNFIVLFPEIRINIIEMVSKEQIKALYKGKIDLGILRTVFLKNELKEYDFEYKVLYKESFVVALPKEHHLAKSSEISIDELADNTFIVPPNESESCCKDITLMLCSQAGFKPILHYEAIHTKTIINLVAANLGVAIVPASISYNKNSYVNFLPIKDTNIQLETAAIWRKGSISEELENFINTLFKTANVKV